MAPFITSKPIAPSSRATAIALWCENRQKQNFEKHSPKASMNTNNTPTLHLCKHFTKKETASNKYSNIAVLPLLIWTLIQFLLNLHWNHFATVSKIDNDSLKSTSFFPWVPVPEWLSAKCVSVHDTLNIQFRQCCAQVQAWYKYVEQIYQQFLFFMAHWGLLWNLWQSTFEIIFNACQYL